MTGPIQTIIPTKTLTRITSLMCCGNYPEKDTKSHEQMYMLMFDHLVDIGYCGPLERYYWPVCEALASMAVQICDGLRYEARFN